MHIDITIKINVEYKKVFFEIRKGGLIMSRDSRRNM